eukprot:6119995-Pyramimonas_sp.AAC.1
MVVMEWKDVELKETSRSEPRVVTEKWADVELECACHLEPEVEGQWFLCGEKMQQIPCGHASWTMDAAGYDGSEW